MYSMFTTIIQYLNNSFAEHPDQLYMTLSLKHESTVKSTSLIKSIVKVICIGKWSKLSNFSNILIVLITELTS